MGKSKKTKGEGPTLAHEAELWANGIEWVFGVDEAGRGCLAGPVSAAVLAWRLGAGMSELPAGIRDSKQLTEVARENRFDEIRASARAHGQAFASAEEIDRWNIVGATSLAVARAIETALRGVAGSTGTALDPTKIAFLSDGNLPLVGRARFFCAHVEYRGELAFTRAVLTKAPLVERCLIGGDDLSLSIAAASILAKVTRDRHMVALDAEFPVYEFRLHKGYFTARHKEVLAAHGPCREHRRSFAPVSLLGQSRTLL